MEEHNPRKMKYLNYLIMLILVMGFATSVTALESYGKFTQGKVVRISQVCQDASYINISSIALPNSTVIYANTPMVSSGSGEYYFNFYNTSLIGRYDVRGISDGCDKTFATYFIVTPTGGLESNTYIFIILITIAIVILLLAFILHNYIFSVIAGFAMMAAGVYGMIYGFGDITSVYTRAISYIIIGLGMIIAVTSGLELMDEMYGGETQSDYNKEDYEEE